MKSAVSHLRLRRRLLLQQQWRKQQQRWPKNFDDAHRRSFEPWALEANQPTYPEGLGKVFLHLRRPSSLTNSEKSEIYLLRPASHLGCRRHCTNRPDHANAEAHSRDPDVSPYCPLPVCPAGLLRTLPHRRVTDSVVSRLAATAMGRFSYLFCGTHRNRELFLTFNVHRSSGTVEGYIRPRRRESNRSGYRINEGINK